jgi:WD40 repeat protein
MRQHKASVNSIAIKENTEWLVSGSDDGTIFLTNLLSYRQELLFKHQVEIKKVMFLEPYDCLVATDSFGTVFFIGVGQSKFKQKVVL